MGPTQTRKAFVIAFAWGCAAFSGCTAQNEAPSVMPFTLQKPIFKFPVDSVEELVIEKNDPVTGDRWSATLRPKTEKSEKPDADTPWQIVSAGERNLIDRRADARFIRHFLDTLQTLVYESPAPNGPMTSFGLEDPLFAIRIRVGSETHELWIGAVTPRSDQSGESSRYARIPSVENAGGFGTRWGIGARTPVLVVRGAAIQMLSYMKSFESVRQRTLVTFHGDDVDEFEFSKTGRQRLYAQRQGDGWADRAQKSLDPTVGRRFEDLAHLRIRQFIDDEEQSRKLTERVSQAPLYAGVFRDRRGRPTEMRIAAIDGELVASITGRDHAPFLLHPESARIFEDLSKGWNR